MKAIRTWRLFSRRNRGSCKRAERPERGERRQRHAGAEAAQKMAAAKAQLPFGGKIAMKGRVGVHNFLTVESDSGRASPGRRRPRTGPG